MSFRAARFAVIDDNPRHVEVLRSALDLLGKPCLGMVYSAADGPTAGWLKGVRVLFLDLHLSQGGLGTDDERHFAVISDLLMQSSSPLGGPFMIVLWTESPEQEQNLRRHLMERIPEDFKYACPVELVSLPKKEFLNTELQDVRDVGALKDAVAQRIAASAQLAAIMAWEDDVHNAAAEALSSLMNSIPTDQRTPQLYGAALSKILNRLAASVVGQANVAGDPRSAMSSALAPILADRIQNQAADEDVQQLWRNALPVGDVGQASAEEAGRVNRMLHVASASAERLNGKDWGVVTSLPFAETSGDFLEHFGLAASEALAEQYFVKQEDMAKGVWRLVQIGAACDHAQPKPMPIPYVLALEFPADVKRSTKNPSRPQEWVSPTFQNEGASGQFVLVANARYVISLSKARADQLQVHYRLREQLLVQLIRRVTDYIARPGVVELRSN